MSESMLARGFQKGPTSQDILAQLLKDGAQRMLAKALEVEVEEYIEKYSHLKDQEGMRVDGIHFNIRLKDECQCILVVMGATKDGIKVSAA